MMKKYRLFFYKNGRIVGRDDFPAHNNNDALRVATLLQDACSDRCLSAELWQGTRSLHSHTAKWQRAHRNLDELRNRLQQVVIEREETIRESEWAIASSQRLLRQLDEARKARSYASSEHDSQLVS